MPPHVAYRLTPLGATFLDAIAPLISWSVQHLDHLDDARALYDALIAPTPAG